jgi:class 3 adenylate cyclase
MKNRRLAAILAADIAGYSRLMGEDEEATVAALKGHQAVLLPLVGGYGGHVVGTAGDGILAEFPSVINAAECAVKRLRPMHSPGRPCRWPRAHMDAHVRRAVQGLDQPAGSGLCVH